MKSFRSRLFIVYILFIWSCDRIQRVKVFYKEGKIKQESEINDKGLNNGLLVNYFQNGNVSSKINFVNGVQEGIGLFYDSLGRLTRSHIFSNSKLNGKQIQFYENGNVKWIKYYKNDIKVGFDTCFYWSGKVWFVTEYKSFGDPKQTKYFNKDGINDEICNYEENFDVMCYVLPSGELKPFFYYKRIGRDDTVRPFLSLEKDRFEYGGDLDYLSKDDSLRIEKYYPLWSTKLKKVVPKPL